jgi:hypothetical protein
MPEITKQQELKIRKLKLRGSSTEEGEAKQIDLRVSNGFSVRFLSVRKEEKEMYKGAEYVFDISSKQRYNFPIKKIRAGDIDALFTSNDYPGLVRVLLPIAQATVQKIIDNDTSALGLFNEGASGVNTTELDAPMRIKNLSEYAVNVRKHLNAAHLEKSNLAWMIGDNFEEKKSFMERLHLSKRKS